MKNLPYQASMIQDAVEGRVIEQQQRGVPNAPWLPWDEKSRLFNFVKYNFRVAPEVAPPGTKEKSTSIFALTGKV